MELDVEKKSDKVLSGNLNQKRDRSNLGWGEVGKELSKQGHYLLVLS